VAKRLKKSIALTFIAHAEVIRGDKGHGVLILLGRGSLGNGRVDIR
jgi:hypothetical protein